MDEEEFQIIFDEASTYSEKERLLLESEFKDIKEFRYQLNDFKELLEKSEGYLINQEIDDRKYTLYTCINDVEDCDIFYKKGADYYVFIDDVASDYKKSQIVQLSDALNDYINNISIIYWIVSDNGIGTIRRKRVFKNNFEEYFIKSEF